MAKAEGIPPTASVASVGPGIRFIGNYVYAYSGVINASSSSAADTGMLDFTSGIGLIMGTIAFQTTEVASNAIYLEVLFNGSTIIDGAWDNSGSGQATANTPIDIVIPPETRVEVKWGITGGTGADATVQIIGRVYGAA